MNKQRENWFSDAVHSSKIPKLVANYKLDTIIQQASSHCTFAEFEVLLSSCALCKTGQEVEISENKLIKIIHECSNIIEVRPKHDIWALNSISQIRDLRPSWFTIPIYKELLSPFNSNSVKILKSTINDIFETARFISEKKENVMPLNSLIELEDFLTIEYSKINSPADLWDKLFVRLIDTTIILHYKAADVIYTNVCKKLHDNLPHFQNNKGKALEKLVQNKMNGFIPYSKKYYSYYINDREKDLLYFNQKIGFCIECKSVKIRASSSDWSKSNLLTDMNPVKEALNQISAPLNMLKNGGNFYELNKKLRIKHKVRSKKKYFGFIITDQIYTPYIRAAIDDVIKLKGSKQMSDHWHGENIWLGSILDFIFLLDVSITPSVLLDYLQWIRSVEHFKNTDEPEAWLAYGTEPCIPIVKSLPINVILRGFDWEVAKEEGIQKFHPFWLERLDSVKKMDSQGAHINALNIVKQDRDKTTRIMCKKNETLLKLHRKKKNWL